MSDVYELDRYRMAHLAICDAGLPSATELIAHRLLAMAELGSGQVNMTWEELAVLTGCENVNAARRHLSRMSAAKLVHYSTNDYVYVTWLEWMQEVEKDTEPARSRASGSAPTRQMEEEVDHETLLFGEADAPPVARGRAPQRVGAPLAARGRAGHSYTRLLVSQSVSTPPLTEGNKQTDSPKRRAIDLDEQRRSVKLLTDAEVGLDASTAWGFAQRFEFDELMRQVMTWRRQVNGGMVSGSGALVHRIKERFGAMITDDDRKSALYRRHHPNWMQDEDQQKRKSYIPEGYEVVIKH